MEADRTRNGQYQVTLRRDLLAEYYDEISFAPVFIEKGNPGISDSAIFNREPFTFNQIKKDELLLNFDKRALTEVYEVLSLLEKSEFNKIPKEIISAIKNNMDKEIYSKALKEYARNKDKNILKLVKYAKKLDIEEEVVELMEILL